MYNYTYTDTYTPGKYIICIIITARPVEFALQPATALVPIAPHRYNWMDQDQTGLHYDVVVDRTDSLWLLFAARCQANHRTG